MGRATLDIGIFSKGIVSLLDPKDLPLDAECWSENVDVDTAPGRLIGRWTDANYSTTKGVDAGWMDWLQRSDGTYDMVYYKPSTDDLRVIDDFHGASPADSSLVDLGSTARVVTMQKHNNVLHIGLGTAAAAKWVGEIDFGQFGAAADTATLQCLASELAPGTVFPHCYKTISDGTSVWGIEWQGKRIWKVTVSTGAAEYSVFEFTKLQGLCNIDATYAYVYDKVGTYGILYKIQKSDMTIIAEYPLDGFNFEGGNCGGPNFTLTVSDIELTTNKIWFGCYGSLGMAGVHEDDGFIYNYSRTTLDANPGESFHPDNVTFDFESQVARTDGRWYTTLDHDTVTPVYRCFVRFGGTEIGYHADFDWELAHSSGSSDPPGEAIVFMNESVARADYLNSTNCRLAEITSTAVSDIIEGSTDCFYLCGKSTSDVLAYEDGTDVWNLAGAVWTSGGAGKWKEWTTGYVTAAKLGGVTDASICFISESAGVDTISVVNAIIPGKWYTSGYDSGTSTWGGSTYKKHSMVRLDFTHPDQSFAADFQANYRYFYNISFVYDNYQESPLLLLTSKADWSVDVLTSEEFSIKIAISLYNTGTTLSKRVSHINLYRAENPDDTALEPSTMYRLVKQVEVTKNWGYNTTESGSWGNRYTFELYDTGTFGPSYETSSGISEVLTTNHVDYQYSAQIMGFHFVGYVKNVYLVANKRLVMRSKQHAFDMFDWSVDYLYMPRDITAMAAFGGALLVFSENEVYKVNPQGMYIEDTYTGIGCPSGQAVKETESGLFFCDKNNMYVFDGRSIIPIGDPVKRSPLSSTITEPWTDVTGNHTLFVAPFPLHNCILFCAGKTAETIKIYVFHLPTKTWRYWTNAGPSGSSYFSSMVDKNGQAYISCLDYLIKVASVYGTRSIFTWWSLDLTFGDASQPKMIDGIQLIGTSGGATVTISDNGGVSFATLTDHTYHDSVMVKVVGTATTDIRTVSIIYRQMLSKSQ